MRGEEEVTAEGAGGKGQGEGSRLSAASNLGQPSLALGLKGTFFLQPPVLLPGTRPHTSQADGAP